MGAILTALQGKKTYIVAAFVIIATLLTKFAGIQIPGYTVGDDWLTPILAALGAAGIRSGINTAIPPK